MTRSTEPKKKKRDKLLEVYREGDFVYVVAKKGIRRKEYDMVVGAYSTLVEMIRGVKREWLN